MSLLSSFFISDSLCQSITIIVLTNPSSDVNNRWLTAKINNIFFCKVSRVSVYWLAICALLHWHHFPLLPSCSDLSHSLHTGPVNIAFFTRILQLAKSCFQCQPLMWPWPWGSKHCPTTLSVCLSVCFRGRICLHVPEDHMANRVCNHSLQTQDNTDHSSNDHFSLQLFVLSDSLSFSLLLCLFFSSMRNHAHKKAAACAHKGQQRFLAANGASGRQWTVGYQPSLDDQHSAVLLAGRLEGLCCHHIVQLTFLMTASSTVFSSLFFLHLYFPSFNQKNSLQPFFIMKTKLFFQFCYCCASSWIAVKIIFAG